MLLDITVFLSFVMFKYCVAYSRPTIWMGWELRNTRSNFTNPIESSEMTFLQRTPKWLDQKGKIM